MAKIIGNTTATPSPIGNLSNLKTKNKNSLVDAINEAAESANGDFVSYSQSQNLTDEQKEIARNNIDAVDANLVVSSFLDPSSHPRDVKIPNGAALFEYVADYSNTSCVRNDVRQEIPAYNQGLARSNIGAVSQAELGSAVIDMVSRNELIGAIAATKATVVSASEQQNFTDEQKQMARTNIGAVSQAELADGLDEKVDASLVVSNILSDTGSGLIVLKNNIPNGNAVAAFVREHGVSSSQTQSLTLTQKARARRNIDVDGGKWELLYTIEGDGETKTWEYTQFADGSPLNLTAVSAVVIQDVAEAENSYGHLYAYSDEKSTQFPAAIYAYFTKNTAPTTSGTQRAYGVVEQYKGQYRAYSVGMAKTANEIMRYTPYMQAKHTTADYPYIDRIKVEKQTGVFSAGNKIEVYGVRCYG